MGHSVHPTNIRCITATWVVAVLVLASSPAEPQVASPLQSGHYLPGTTNIRDMATPPPGFFVAWYNLYPWTDTYVDRNGNELTNLNQVNPALPDVPVNVDGQAFATIPALMWASPFKFLGGARYMAFVVPNFIVADYTAVLEPGGPILDSAIVVDGSVSGFSDLYVAPVGLSWGSDVVDFTVMYGFYAPTGRYATGADDNIGLGFWTHQFQAFGYVYPLPQKATAITVGGTFELNSTIEDRDVKPGSRFSLDWGVSQYLSSRFELGVQGGNNWQIGDDSGDDVFWDPSFHDRKSSIGFSAGFWPWESRLYMAAKYTLEFGIRQHFKNNNLMLNFIFITNALAGS